MGAKDFIEKERERYRETRPGEDYDAIHGARDRELLAEEKRGEIRVYAVMTGIILAAIGLVAISGVKNEKAPQERDTGAIKTSQGAKIVQLADGKTFRLEVQGKSIDDARGDLASFAIAHPDAKVKDFQIDDKSGKITIEVTVEK